MISQLKERIAEVDGEVEHIQGSMTTINDAVQENVNHVMSISSSSEQVSTTLNDNIQSLSTAGMRASQTSVIPSANP